MNDINPFADEDLTQDRERAEHCRKCGGAVDYPVRQMVDFEAAICKIADACTGCRRGIGVSDYDYAVAAVYEFLFVNSAGWSLQGGKREVREGCSGLGRPAGTHQKHM